MILFDERAWKTLALFRELWYLRGRLIFLVLTVLVLLPSVVTITVSQTLDWINSDHIWVKQSIESIESKRSIQREKAALSACAHKNSKKSILLFSLILIPNFSLST